MPELTRDQIMARRREEMKELKAVFGPSEQKAVTLFEDAPCYPSKDLTELFHIGVRIQKVQDKEERLRLIAEYDAKRDSIQRLPNAPERVYLWPEGKIPCVTEYTDNSDYRYHHNPDFVPFFYEMLVPEDVTPKGLIVFCAGGDHGTALYHEGYQSCLDFNKLGYQAILLANRTNMCPWKGVDAGADAARAIRMARANAKKYRVREDQIAFAGFSNGGLTGEMVIQYFSGDKKMIKRFYGLDPAQFEACILYYPTTNMMAEELLIVKLSDMSQQEMVRAAVEARIATQKNTFEGYGVEQFEMLSNNAVIEVRGNYILFVVNANSAAAQKAFLGAI